MLSLHALKTEEIDDEDGLEEVVDDDDGPEVEELDEVLADGARRMMPEIMPTEARPGTLVLFRMAPRAIAKHVGILTEPDRFIHAYERLGVVEEVLTPAWARKIAFAFLFPNNAASQGSGIPSDQAKAGPVRK
jgi:cell wall-associated NlpC family hydrolase